MANVDRDFILEQFEYHHWAADRVLGATAALNADRLDDEWGGSFKTGRALLRHVVGVEFLWCERWNGRSPKALPEYPPTWSGRDFLNEWHRIEGAQREYLGRLSRDMLLSELTYTNFKGERLTYRLSDTLIHVVNHGSYHRGQLTHLLRDRGMAAPSSDYTVWLAERRKTPA